MTAVPGAGNAEIALFLPALEGGGAERVFVELANEFATQGQSVDFVLAHAEGPYLADISRDVRVVELGASRVVSALPALASYLRRRRPTALLSGLDHANVVAVLANLWAGRATRCVISIRSVPTEVYRRADSTGGRFLLRAMKLSYRFADAIVANSHAVASDLSRLMRVPVAGVSVIHNPLNLARIEQQSRQPVLHEWCSQATPPLILGVGSLTPLKDFPTLIRAFAVLRSGRGCRLAILGEGPERSKLAAVAQHAGVASDVLMPGFVPNPFVWMRHAAVFVSSSLTEGCPNAVMQALALGTPIVSTDCIGGSAELLENGRWGKLVPVGNHVKMADAIGEYLNGGTRLESPRRAAEFSHERVARRYLEVLLPDRYGQQGHVARRRLP